MITQKQFSPCAGFTLIELLVVVLIMGILSAVALPQYEAVMDKTRVTGYIFPKLKAACQAQQVYIMANGAWTSDFTNLDIDISSDCAINGENNNTLSCRAGHQDFNFYMTDGNRNIASHYKLVAFDVFPQGSGALEPCQIYCRLNSSNKEASRKFCARFGEPVTPDSLYYQVQ